MRKFLTLIMMSFFSMTAMSQESLIEVGVGALADADKTVEAILHVKGSYTPGSDDATDGYFIAVRFNADGSIASGNFNYVDISIHALGGGFGTDNTVVNTFIEGTLLNINYKRNLSLGLDNMLTVSLIGLRTGTSVAISDNLRLFAETALDFVALGLSSKRASDAASLSKQGLNSGLNARIEIAAEMYNKVRIAFGYNEQVVSGKGIEYYDGTVTCSTYGDGGWYDDWGYYHATSYVTCVNNTSIDYLENWRHKSLYLSLNAKLAERLTLFGRASYNVFKVNDRTNAIADSRQSGWMFMFGVAYAITK